jgi:hypothetical protein
MTKNRKFVVKEKRIIQSKNSFKPFFVDLITLKLSASVLRVKYRVDCMRFRARENEIFVFKNRQSVI